MSDVARLDAVVVGAGRFGTALAATLARLGRRVELWARRTDQADEINDRRSNARYLPGVTLPHGLIATADLGSAVRRARLVLMVVPSQSFREVARTVGDHLGGDQLVVHATKGLEVDTFKRMSQVLREETCALKIGVLAGPTMARGLIAGDPSGSIVASRYDEVSHGISDLFAGGPLRVYTGRDVVGTEVASAFRNVVALAAGVSDGLGFGEGTKSLLVTRGLVEMARLGVAMGGEPLTFGGLAGVGDLLATCFSPGSVNREVGVRLARGESIEAILESIPAAPEGVPMTLACKRHAAALALHLPIVDALHALVHEGAPVQTVVSELLATPVGPEMAQLPGRAVAR